CKGQQARVCMEPESEFQKRNPGESSLTNDIVTVGGGPSGLAAAYEAIGHGARAIVLERLDRLGGLARTVEFEGSRWDIGPHRFFTRNREVHDLFVRIAGEDLVHVPRQTRILYNNKLFDYPLTPLNALFGVGVLESLWIFADYGLARVRSRFGNSRIENFEDWIVDRFGRKLFQTFFKTYTEKVWGISCKEIGADWASQRIKGLSLTEAVRNALFKSKSKQIKTLIDEFMYPRLGAGQLYEKMAARIVRSGSEVLTRSQVLRIRREGTRVRSVTVNHGDDGSQNVEGRYFLISAPLTDMVQMMEPAAPPEILAACRALRYRDHIGVNLLVEGRPFPDNWIYVHSANVAMARVTNYSNFSPAMGSRPDLNPLTVEYFTFPGDGIWDAPDPSLIERATRELDLVGLLKGARVTNGFVVRNERAYPVIEIGYERHISIIKEWLDQFDNLLPIGRSGMFKYNNQDHAMATGLLAARTALDLGRFDPWRVNIDAEYHESGPPPE
ncbi:MAG: NAD(P)/FAD-dependent oxidoreductase, partial [Bryobacteraceae bacterium]